MLPPAVKSMEFPIIMPTTIRYSLIPKAAPKPVKHLATNSSRQPANFSPSSRGITDTNSGDTINRRIISNIRCTNWIKQIARIIKRKIDTP